MKLPGTCRYGRPAIGGSALPSGYACKKAAGPRGHRDRPACPARRARPLTSSRWSASLRPCTREMTPSPARCSSTSPRTRRCHASRADPLPLEGLRERFLPERTFCGRQNTKLQYAVLAAAALQGGTEPDLLDEVAWWQTDDFWQYALFATIAYIRAAASQAGTPVRQACQYLAERQDRPGP